MPYKKVYKKLAKAGWEIIRKRGSHFRWQHNETNEKVTTCWCEGNLEKHEIKILEKKFGVKLV